MRCPVDNKKNRLGLEVYSAEVCKDVLRCPGGV